MSGDQLAMFRARIDGGMVLGLEPAEPTAPPAEHLHRSDDQGGSIASAERVVAGGSAAVEASLVLAALLDNPGSTSAELAQKTTALGEQFDQDAHAWRTTCARRLPGLEDQGLVRAEVARPSIRRPNRAVNPDLAPCTVSPGAPQSIRWWPR